MNNDQKMKLLKQFIESIDLAVAEGNYGGPYTWEFRMFNVSVSNDRFTLDVQVDKVPIIGNSLESNHALTMNPDKDKDPLGIDTPKKR